MVKISIEIFTGWGSILLLKVIRKYALIVSLGRKAALFFSLSIISMVSSAQETKAELQNLLSEQEFSLCIISLQEKALEAGISDKTTNEVLGASRYLTNVIGYDRNQPEFVQTFPNYMRKRVNDWRINKGREMLSKHRELLTNLTQKYGIPAHYLVAFWGLETNFGAYKGKMPIIDSLATLACDPRRSEFFSKELILALELMERENLATETMVGSWAGAMGHTQFMPSAYLQYAVDGDGDNKVNLWDSEVDALTSAANFLRHLGWVSGYKWGREVALNENFDHKLAGKDKVHHLSYWSENGVTKTDGGDLGNSDIDASLLLPAGHTGPAFLVYSNFDVIMRWNNSESYALAVGYLADRIIGKPRLSQPLPEMPDYKVDTLRELQLSLNSLGFDVGEADGIYGPATRSGIQSFQALNQMIADGFPDQKLFDAVKQAVNSQKNATL